MRNTGTRATDMASQRSLERLLAEQIAYYRARAPEYEEHAIPGWHGEELVRALESFQPTGRVLELACGPGVWTEQLVRHARSTTAIDAAPEMLAIARARIGDERVRFLAADIFSWQPDGRYDVVALAFWLSHVPPERFERFWELLAACLRPGGRVFFIDDTHRTADELLEGESGWTVRRCLTDGSTHRIVKVAHDAAELERRLAGLGWQVRVTRTSGPFFWGEGTRAQPARSAGPLPGVD